MVKYDTVVLYGEVKGPSQKLIDAFRMAPRLCGGQLERLVVNVEVDNPLIPQVPVIFQTKYCSESLQKINWAS